MVGRKPDNCLLVIKQFAMPLWLNCHIVTSQSGVPCPPVDVIKTRHIDGPVENKNRIGRKIPRDLSFKKNNKLCKIKIVSQMCLQPFRKKRKKKPSESQI